MRKALVAVAALLATHAAMAQSQESAISTSALINAALDKQIKLSLNDPLPGALDKITQKSGVPIDVPSSVWDVLPWGQDTPIIARIENQTLRQALDAITRKLGLIYEVRDEDVQLELLPALQRLARRATTQELAALDQLAATPLELAQTHATARQVVDAVDARLVAIKSPQAVENRAGDALHPDMELDVPRNASLMDALEMIDARTGATWYPWGKSIMIVDKRDQIRRQLARVVTLRYTGVDLSQVLADLSQRSGVHFAIEPGTVLAVPADARNVRLVLENVSIQDALEALCGYTGLGYAVRDNSVYVWHQAATAPGRNPILGIIQLDSGLQLLVPESQVPPDLREYLKFKMQKSLDKLREQMKADGFTPTTNPSTQP